MAHLLFFLYRVCWEVAASWPVAKMIGLERGEAFSYLKNKLKAKSQANSVDLRLWVHASSAGELEILWPICESLAKSAQDGKINLEFVLTVFSASGLKPLKNLESKLIRYSHCRVRFAGLSPLEMEWDEGILLFKPHGWITAKYEAWPALWVALARRNIPLILVGAKVRRSVRMARRACLFWAKKLPSILFLTTDRDDALKLVELFIREKTSVRIEAVGDPRWDRVSARAHALDSPSKERVSRLSQTFANAPRPWGVLGQVWAEDFKILEDGLRNFKGTLWVVPHRLDDETLQVVRDFFNQDSDGSIYCTSSVPLADEMSLSKTKCILVDEMGILSELYSEMDWAYVGGGFGQGVHSTIEPAIWGIPIAIGPGRSQLFPEIQVLEKDGQLKIIQNPGEWSDWLREIQNASGHLLKKEHWKAQAQSRKGATERSVAFIKETLKNDPALS